MYRVHHYKYAPILIGAEKRYRIELPLDVTPVVYRTLTAPMRSWVGEFVEGRDGLARALIWEAGKVVEISGLQLADIPAGNPCVVMEHLTVDGDLEFMIGDSNIMDGNNNFVNFGIPQGKHVRIDIYTGDSRIIE